MIDAVIFDMDGVLIDSEPLWRIAEVEALSAVGVPIDDEAARLTTGLRMDEVVGYWFARFPWSGPSQNEVEARIVRRFIGLVRERGEPLAGVTHVLAMLGDAGLPLAVASSSAEAVIAVVVERLGLSEHFRVIQSAEHEQFGKPHPAVYLAAARALGVSPDRCLAFEDSPNGVIAALAARMRCIAIPDPALARDRRFLAADAVLPSLEAFGSDELTHWTGVSLPPW